MTPEQIADALAESRDYIEKVGWRQGDLGLPGNVVCSLGGLYVSQGWWEYEVYEGAPLDYLGAIMWTNEREVVEVCEAFATALDLPNPNGGPSTTSGSSRVVAWNDADGRTQQEVLDGFAKAEKIIRSGYDPDAP